MGHLSPHRICGPAVRSPQCCIRCGFHRSVRAPRNNCSRRKRARCAQIADSCGICWSSERGHLASETNMKPLDPRLGINRRVLFSSLALLPVLQPCTSSAQQTARGSNRAFSFVVYGDSRSMMYLPYKSDQRDEAIKLMVDIFVSHQLNGFIPLIRLVREVHHRP